MARIVIEVDPRELNEKAMKKLADLLRELARSPRYSVLEAVFEEEKG